MYRGYTVGVVIPAYNEAPFIGRVIDTIPEFVDKVYVIDDGSTDETWTEIRRRTAPSVREPAVSSTDGGTQFDHRIVPVRHRKNRGVGAAIKTGFHRAKADQLDVTATMNGDAQMDPEILPRILDPVVDGRADYAKGNRLYSATDRDAMSLWRLFGNVLLTGVTRIASGYWHLLDSQNGYTAISLDALRTIQIDDLYDKYGFLNDILVKLSAHGMVVEDVQMQAVYGDEESGISYSTFVPELSWLLLKRFVWRLWKTYFVRQERLQER